MTTKKEVGNSFNVPSMIFPIVHISSTSRDTHRQHTRGPSVYGRTHRLLVLRERIKRTVVPPRPSLALEQGEGTVRMNTVYPCLRHTYTPRAQVQAWVGHRMGNHCITAYVQEKHDAGPIRPSEETPWPEIVQPPPVPSPSLLPKGQYLHPETDKCHPMLGDGGRGGGSSVCV